MGAGESFLTAVHSAAPRCSLTALKMSDCNTGAVGQDRIISLCCVSVSIILTHPFDPPLSPPHTPTLYSQRALKSVAPNHAAKLPGPYKQHARSSLSLSLSLGLSSSCSLSVYLSVFVPQCTRPLPAPTH